MDGGAQPSLTVAEKEELVSLRAEVHDLKAKLLALQSAVTPLSASVDHVAALEQAHGEHQRLEARVRTTRAVTATARATAVAETLWLRSRAGALKEAVHDLESAARGAAPHFHVNVFSERLARRCSSAGLGEALEWLGYHADLQ